MRSAMRIGGLYLAMSIAVIAATLISLPFFSEAPLGDFEAARAQLGSGWLAWEFAYSVPIALAAGFFAARWAPAAALRHTGALAGVVLVMGVFSVVFSAGRKPVAHDVALTLVGSCAVLAGGWLYARRRTGAAPS